MYQVLARKWRPQTLEDLVGQQHVARTLANAVRERRLAHAYVFAGLRGTGKTTVARILAKCLNCVRGPTPEPCGVCDACREIADSRAMDVLEIDAASRTKVEQTRELLEIISYAPTRDRYRILIIDEAHMLSKASFNALLKTLEEPPPNVLFVLATTELHKVLPTILSRCQVFEFRRVGVAEVAAYLRRICEAESFRISDGALERLARAGEGSVRDSLSLLERLVAFCGTELEDEDVLRSLGTVRVEVMADLVRSLAARDAGGMLRVLDALMDEGHDLIHLWMEWIAALRDLLLARALPDRAELLSRSAEEAHALCEAGAALSVEDLVRAFQILADLEPGLKSSSRPRYLFEATLIRLASLGAVRPIEEILGALEAGPPLPVASTAAAPKKKETPAGPPEIPAGGDSAARLTEAIGRARPMVGAMLAQASLSVVDGRVEIRLPRGMEAVRRQLERADSLRSIQEQADAVLGRRAEVRLVPEPSEGARDEESPPASAAERKRVGGRSRDLLDAARREPGVQRVLTTLEAQILGVEALEDASVDGKRPESGGPAEGSR